MVVGKMIARGWLEEVEANLRRGEPMWRETGDGHGTTLIATEAGLPAGVFNVVNGDAKLPQALIKDKRLDTLHLLPASQTRDKDALTEEGVAKVIGEMRERFAAVQPRTLGEAKRVPGCTPACYAALWRACHSP